MNITMQVKWRLVLSCFCPSVPELHKHSYLRTLQEMSLDT